jgi:hypothetical protein
MTNNLPQKTIQDTSETVKQFFDKYYLTPVTFPSNQIDAVVGFFQRRGFDLDSSRSTAIVILNEAKNDGINPFQLLDTMKSLTDAQLSQLVAQVLNSYREKTSLLGYRVAAVANPYESRNILV